MLWRCVQRLRHLLLAIVCALSRGDTVSHKNLVESSVPQELDGSDIPEDVAREAHQAETLPRAAVLRSPLNDTPDPHMKPRSYSLPDPVRAYAPHRMPWRVRSRRFAGMAGWLLGDIVLILIGCVLAYWMRYQMTWPAPLNRIVREVLSPNQAALNDFQTYFFALTLLLVTIYSFKGLYRLPRTAGVLDHAGIIIGGTTTGVAILIVLLFIITPYQFYSRLIYAFAWFTIIVLLCAWRGLQVELQRWRWTRGYGRERVLVVGGTGLGRDIMEGVVAQPFLGYALVGYLDDRAPAPTARKDGHFRYLGTVDELAMMARAYGIDQVILALPFWENRRLPQLVAACRAAGVEFRVAPDLYELSFDRVDVGTLGGIPLIDLKEVSLKGLNLYIKRAMDLLLVLLASPFVLFVGGLIALAIRRDSHGSVIFWQWRVGKGGQLFKTYKFRTMVQDAEARKAEVASLNEADGPIFKIRNDPRMTRVGRLLRRTSLDELPQLWNVLRGEMSLVGPRPPTIDEVERYDPWHKRRLEVLPGLTGLWQVLGRSDTSFDEMVRLDIYYAENWTPLLDLRIMLQTIPAVLSGKGAY